MKPTKSDLVKGLLLDPFKACIVDVNVPSGAFEERWRHLLDAEHVECVRFQFPGRVGLHAVWIDEAGYLREPQPYPQFKIAGIAGLNGDHPFAGYGIVTGLSADNEHLSDVRISNLELGKLVQFETWGKRLPMEGYLDQLLRLYLPWP